MKCKWIYVIIGTVVGIILVGGGVCWDNSAADRAADAELETMIKYAQRQALEIAIIEQASKLTDYRKQLETMQNPVPPIVEPVVIPELPVVADPKDVEIQ